jgi:hypothetical protein
MIMPWYEFNFLKSEAQQNAENRARLRLAQQALSTAQVKLNDELDGLRENVASAQQRVDTKSKTLDSHLRLLEDTLVIKGEEKAKLKAATTEEDIQHYKSQVAIYDDALKGIKDRVKGAENEVKEAKKEHKTAAEAFNERENKGNKDITDLEKKIIQLGGSVRAPSTSADSFPSERVFEGRVGAQASRETASRGRALPAEIRRFQEEGIQTFNSMKNSGAFSGEPTIERRENGSLGLNFAQTDDLEKFLLERARLGDNAELTRNGVVEYKVHDGQVFKGPKFTESLRPLPPPQRRQFNEDFEDEMDSSFRGLSPRDDAQALERQSTVRRGERLEDTLSDDLSAVSDEDIEAQQFDRLIDMAYERGYSNDENHANAEYIAAKNEYESAFGDINHNDLERLNQAEIDGRAIKVAEGRQPSLQGARAAQPVVAGLPPLAPRAVNEAGSVLPPTGTVVSQGEMRGAQQALRGSTTLAQDTRLPAGTMVQEPALGQQQASTSQQGGRQPLPPPPPMPPRPVGDASSPERSAPVPDSRQGNKGLGIGGGVAVDVNLQQPVSMVQPQPVGVQAQQQSQQAHSVATDQQKREVLLNSLSEAAHRAGYELGRTGLSVEKARNLTAGDKNSACKKAVDDVRNAFMNLGTISENEKTQYYVEPLQDGSNKGRDEKNKQARDSVTGDMDGAKAPSAPAAVSAAPSAVKSSPVMMAGQPSSSTAVSKAALQQLDRPPLGQTPLDSLKAAAKELGIQCAGSGARYFELKDFNDSSKVESVPKNVKAAYEKYNKAQKAYESSNSDDNNNDALVKSYQEGLRDGAREASAQGRDEPPPPRP